MIRRVKQVRGKGYCVAENVPFLGGGTICVLLPVTIQGKPTWTSWLGPSYWVHWPFYLGAGVFVLGLPSALSMAAIFSPGKETLASATWPLGKRILA